MVEPPDPKTYCNLTTTFFHLLYIFQLFWCTRGPLPDTPPGGEGHDAVVDHVQRRQVAELLPHQKEDGVEVVDVLAEEVPPGHVQGVVTVLNAG